MVLYIFIIVGTYYTYYGTIHIMVVYILYKVSIIHIMVGTIDIMVLLPN